MNDKLFLDTEQLSYFISSEREPHEFAEFVGITKDLISSSLSDKDNHEYDEFTVLEKKDKDIIVEKYCKTRSSLNKLMNSLNEKISNSYDRLQVLNERTSIFIKNIEINNKARLKDLIERHEEIKFNTEKNYREEEQEISNRLSLAYENIDQYIALAMKDQSEKYSNFLVKATKQCESAQNQLSSLMEQLKSHKQQEGNYASQEEKRFATLHEKITIECQDKQIEYENTIQKMNEEIEFTKKMIEDENGNTQKMMERMTKEYIEEHKENDAAMRKEMENINNKIRELSAQLSEHRLESNRLDIQRESKIQNVNDEKMPKIEEEKKITQRLINKDNEVVKEKYMKAITDLQNEIASTEEKRSKQLAKLEEKANKETGQLDREVLKLKSAFAREIEKYNNNLTELQQQLITEQAQIDIDKKNFIQEKQKALDIYYSRMEKKEEQFKNMMTIVDIQFNEQQSYLSRLLSIAVAEQDLNLARNIKKLRSTQEKRRKEVIDTIENEHLAKQSEAKVYSASELDNIIKGQNSRFEQLDIKISGLINIQNQTMNVMNNEFAMYGITKTNDPRLRYQHVIIQNQQIKDSMNIIQDQYKAMMKKLEVQFVDFNQKRKSGKDVEDPVISAMFSGITSKEYHQETEAIKKFMLKSVDDLDRHLRSIQDFTDKIYHFAEVYRQHMIQETYEEGHITSEVSHNFWEQQHDEKMHSIELKLEDAAEDCEKRKVEIEDAAQKKQDDDYRLYLLKNKEIEMKIVEVKNEIKVLSQDIVKLQCKECADCTIKKQVIKDLLVKRDELSAQVEKRTQDVVQVNHEMDDTFLETAVPVQIRSPSHDSILRQPSLSSARSKFKPLNTNRSCYGHLNQANIPSTQLSLARPQTATTPISKLMGSPSYY